MLAPVGSRSSWLRALGIGVVLLCCSACNQGEDTPLGSPSYLPPDPASGGAAAGSSQTASGGTAVGVGGSAGVSGIA